MLPVLQVLTPDIRSDNGPEFIAKAVQDWIAQRGCKTLYIEPGSPWQNAYSDSFNSRFRDEFLNRNPRIRNGNGQNRPGAGSKSRDEQLYRVNLTADEDEEYPAPVQTLKSLPLTPLCRPTHH